MGHKNLFELRKFISWLFSLVAAVLKIKSKAHQKSETKWILKFGKMAARETTRQCYYKDCFGMARKMKLADPRRNSYTGWQHSKAVLD